MADMRGPRDRGVSEVLGYILIFTLIIVSVSIVSVGGISSLENARTAEQIENGKKAFDVLDTNMAEMYYEEAPSRATEFSLGDTELIKDDNVTVRVHLYDGSVWDNDTTYRIRPVVQRLGEERNLIYEAGAVFQTGRESGYVFRDPPLVSRSNSIHLTIPALQSGSVRSIGGTTVLVRGKVDQRDVVVRDTEDEYDKFVINVTSPRADYWSEYLEGEGFDCTDTVPDTVECDRSGPFSRLFVTAHEIDISLIS